MTPEEYIDNVLITESSDMEAIKKRLSDPNIIRILHAAMGMSTEANEILDMLKKHIFYGKSFDVINMEEELGDSNWYQAVAIHALRLRGYHTSFEQIWDKNIRKLRSRYGKGFSEKRAMERDLDKEREILEEEICEYCGTAKKDPVYSTCCEEFVQEGTTSVYCLGCGHLRKCHEQ